MSTVSLNYCYKNKIAIANFLIQNRIIILLDLLRYLRKCFFPKHQDLQYAGKKKKLCPVPVALKHQVKLFF